MTANDVGEIENDDSKSPLKQDDCPVLASPILYDARGGQLQGTSNRNCVYKIDKNVDQCGTSFSGERPCASHQSIDQTDYVAKDAKVEKHKNAVLDIVDFPSKDVTHAKQRQWSHLYKLVNGSNHKVSDGDPLSRAKDKLMISVRENSRIGDADTWHLSQLRTKHSDENGAVCVDGMDGKNPKFESTLLPRDARSKILSTSSFFHFFGKKIPKGKGVINGHVDDKTDLDNGGELQSSNGRLFSAAGVTSAAQMQLLQHRSGGTVFDSNHDGINLREWLKPGYRTKNKLEGLSLFRQIVELVNLAHSHGAVLQHLRPSYFFLKTSNKLDYIGSSTQMKLDVPLFQSRCKKRPPEEDIHSFCTSDTKQQRLNVDMEYKNHSSLANSRSGPLVAALQETNYDTGCKSGSDNFEHRLLNQAAGMKKSFLADLQLEERWYACPEELNGKNCNFQSNIYGLGVLLFELLCPFDSLEAHSAAMFDMHHRILPPLFLSESPKEAGFVLWLMHPEPSSRPTIREILQCELFCGLEELHTNGELATFANDDGMADTELLQDFLVSLKEKKQDLAVKLVEVIRCIEADIKGLEEKPFSTACSANVKEGNLQDYIKSVAKSVRNEARLINDMSQLERAYFAMRSHKSVKTGAGRADRDLLKNRDTGSQKQKQNEVVSMNQTSATASGLDLFYEGLCKFTCYSKFELRGTLRNSDLLNSANVICSLSFDRDEEYIAVAGVSKKIKIFEFSALVKDTIDIHYPVIEMVNKSKLSCISWNGYIKNYLASADYDGIVQVWDASTGQGFSQHIEHQKRAWSVDFSRVDPTKFASGGDDCSVKLWCTNEKRSTCTIWSPANVCCVQFSPYSSNLLTFGSADYKIYGYDLRHLRIPWCTLAGHEKTVSYVKFLDSETLVSASTDNTLKIWDLNNTSLSGLSSDACHLTFSGHTNKKHFVGLAVRDGYIACGSESNEVFTYYRSLPMPVTSYKFRPIDSVDPNEIGDDNGLFVSSVCWRTKSNMVVAANSGGSIRLLQLV